MTHSLIGLYRRTRLGLSGVALLVLAIACGSDQLNPSSDAGGESLTADSLATTPVDSSGVPTDSTLPPVDSTLTDSTLTDLPDSTAGDTSGIVIETATAATHTGIVFGVFNMQGKYLTTVLNGSMQGLEPSWLMAELVLARAKGGRVILKMVGGSDERVKNSDGTFSLTKWKALVDRFKSVNFTSYINDGTLMGVFLIDEPHNTSKWGGRTISHATVEAMAKHTKQAWPNMTTFVRARPTWLVQTPITYVYLDAGWFQYESYMGNVSTAITKEVTAAKAKRLGLAVGLNVLSGGNGSSGAVESVSRVWLLQLDAHRRRRRVLRAERHQERNVVPVDQGQGPYQDVLPPVTHMAAPYVFGPRAILGSIVFAHL
jgi:hypothetical protein